MDMPIWGDASIVISQDIPVQPSTSPISNTLARPERVSNSAIGWSLILLNAYSSTIAELLCNGNVCAPATTVACLWANYASTNQLLYSVSHLINYSISAMFSSVAVSPIQRFPCKCLQSRKFDGWVNEFSWAISLGQVVACSRVSCRICGDVASSSLAWIVHVPLWLWARSSFAQSSNLLLLPSNLFLFSILAIANKQLTCTLLQLQYYSTKCTVLQY